jgi:two-component system chemotaxis sensor kinase CheA
MAKKTDELQKRLLVTFRIEADEHLKAMMLGLLALEKAPAGSETTSIVEVIFREAHSLKGAARAVNLITIESICQSLENVFAVLKNGRLEISVSLLDLLHQAINGLGMLLASEPDSSVAPPRIIAELTRQLEQAASGATLGSPAKKVPEVVTSVPHMLSVALGQTVGTVRIPTSKLDSVMRQVEELLSPRLAARERTFALRDTAVSLAAWKKARMQIQPALRCIERSVARGAGLSGSANKHNELQKVLDYLDEERLFITTLENRLAKLNKSASHDQRTLVSMTDSLLHDVKKMQLLPFASLLEILPHLVRELSREQGKEVELVIHGSDIELDRRMLEELKDPLIHLLRNAIDHGIETPDRRVASNKSVHGTVTLTISQQDSGKVAIQLADDGAGIDGERVKAAARKFGMLSTEDDEDLNERDVLALVFKSGVSTSPIITDVSGRGLGLAIVWEKVEHLGGSISIQSHPGSGTTFHIVLPLSMATFRGVLVRVGEQLCVIPATGVERVARVAMHEIRTVENRETIMLDDKVISLVGLRDILEMSASAVSDQAAHAPVVILGQNAVHIAFRVDEIFGEQEILVKSLGPQLIRVRNIAGATMLGTGRVVPVLNVADLLKSAVTHAVTPLASSASEQSVTGVKQSILIVEDSITSRSLLKHILESAGYSVTTAVDGMDGYTTLKTAAFDLVVSDVEMPRMDGFDLTAKIRADRQFAELPVVLVTALESREHRERGIDVGANAYVVKSSFDQSNLLEIIQRLI